MDRVPERLRDRLGIAIAKSEHTSIGSPLPADGGDYEQLLAEFAKAGGECGFAGCRTSGRRGPFVRQVLERSDGRDSIEMRYSQGSCPESRRVAGPGSAV